MTKRTISNQPGEERRFEVLLEEIRGQLRLICEAQSESVKRDEALDAKIEKMRKDFYDLASNIHADLQERIDSVDHKLTERIDSVEQKLTGRIDMLEKSLRKDIQEVKEILISHDKRISTLENISST